MAAESEELNNKKVVHHGYFKELPEAIGIEDMKFTEPKKSKKLSKSAKSQSPWRRFWKAIGYGRGPVGNDVVAWASAAVVYYILIMVVSVVASAILPKEVMEQSQGINLAPLKSNTWRLTLNVMYLCVVVPFVEETLFRGVLYAWIKKLFKGHFKVLAAIIVSLIFGILHGQVNVAIVAFVLSMVSCYLREDTGAIWSSVMLHATFNSISTVMLLMA